ncbi:hypothetical protein EJB05_06054, partial [Eragrostis curvula]
MDDVVVLGISSARHSCKVCGKGFPCGRSLGGHMRSHSLAEVAMADEADDDDEEEESGTRGTNGAVVESGYGLRENPKKTRRLSGLDDDDGEDDHGDRGDKEMFSSPEPTLDDYAAAAGEHDGAAARDDDEEHVRLIPTEAAAVLMPAPRRRRRSMRVPAPAPAPPPRDAFDREPEDVALCLIMLSRDTPAGNSRWAAAAPATADRRKRNGGYYHYHDADSDDASAFFNAYAGDKIKQKRKAAACGGDESKQRSGRYECPGCGRAFQSYQALGGHRASHKRINSSCCITTKVDQPEPSADDTTTNTSFSTASAPASPEVDRTKAKRMTATASKFECPICFKVFGSGQALGGHKRSHSIAGELYDRADAAGIVEPEQQSLVRMSDLEKNKTRQWQLIILVVGQIRQDPTNKITALDLSLSLSSFLSLEEHIPDLTQGVQ